MKKLLLGCVAFAALALPANAADLPVKASVPAAYNWSGCYIGGNAGGKWGRFDAGADTAAGIITIPGVGTVPLAAGHADLDPVYTSSVAAGGQLGCRWQNRDHWVFGIEGDFDWANLKGTATVNGIDPLFPCVFGICNGDTFTFRSQWESSARVILGRSFDRWLVYATGGFAFTRVSMNANFVPAAVGGGVAFPGASGSDSKVLNGGTVGVGAAYGLGRNWEVGAEYRYTYYQTASFNLGNGTPFCATPIGGGAPVCVSPPVTGHAGLQTNEILFRLNYRFDWARPVVASD
jgi:outer membrane immunogenic protein